MKLDQNTQFLWAFGQIREAIRAAMKKEPYIAESFDDGTSFASKRMSVGKSEWLSRGSVA